MGNKIVSIVILMLAAVIGFGGGFIAKKIHKDDEDKIIKTKIITKAVALLMVIADLIISIL